MADITLNSAVRSNLRTLQSTTDLMNRTEERLSTGKKVNSAFDNPGNFFTAKALNNRAGDLNNLLDAVSSSVKTIEAADNGISAISDLVNQLKSSARSAQQSTSAVTTRASFTSAAVSGATTTNLLGSSYQQVAGTTAVTVDDGGEDVGASETAALADLTSTAIAADDTITVGGQTIKFYADQDAIDDADDADEDFVKIALDTATLGDVLDAIGEAVDGEATIDEDGMITVRGPLEGSSFQFGGDAAAALGLPTTASATTNDLDGKTLEVTVADGSKKTITFGTDTSEVNTLEELNEALETIGAQAKISTDGELTIQTSNEYAAQNLTIGGTAVEATASASADHSGQIFDLTSTTLTASAVTGGDGKTTRTDYLNDYNDVRSQISKLAKDASFNGVNLLSGDDLTVIFNENGSSTLDVGGVDIMDRLGLEDLTFDDFADSSSIEAVVSKLNSALTSLDTLSSRFGSQLSVVQTRQSFTKDMVGTLQDGADALTNADTNAEAANLATLQTRQSLIVSSLSISTSQEQNVLQLLR